MKDRVKTRQIDNYTYFFGNLTEEEMQYRDYFETDLEADSDDEYMEELQLKAGLAATGQFDPRRFDFVETAMVTEVHENFQDVIEDKVFKFKYR